ncbi:MAG: hypothetical protein JXA52_04080 [Planctomycetes bacterium]|nr:hypothetical protein [Planctomycetota bacterium]
MRSAEEVRQEVCAVLAAYPPPAAGQLRFLITAGPTYEDLDAVRYLGNRSTGRMGFAVAEAALKAGHQVLLVVGPTPVPPPEEAVTVKVRSAQEMAAAVLAALAWSQVLVMSAAVADYRPEKYTDGKIHKTKDELVIRCVRTPDILASVNRQKNKPVIIGFSLEPEVDQEMAEAKRATKGMDIIAANTTASFGESFSDAVVLEDGREVFTPGNTKEELARYLVARAEELAKKR